MTLNDRIIVRCAPCSGTGKAWRGQLESYVQCRVCTGDGRDRESEARLAELAARLPDAASVVMVAAAAARGHPDRSANLHALSDELDELAEMLLLG